jgi:hypothetical protein
LYVLESALDDVEGDLGPEPGDADYKRAFQHLYAAAAHLRNACVPPKAVLDRGPNIGVTDEAEIG